MRKLLVWAALAFVMLPTVGVAQGYPLSGSRGFDIDNHWQDEAPALEEATCEALYRIVLMKCSLFECGIQKLTCIAINLPQLVCEARYNDCSRRALEMASPSEQCLAHAEAARTQCQGSSSR